MHGRELEQMLAARLDVGAVQLKPVGGGDICDAFCVLAGERRWFLKSRRDGGELLGAERDGLAALAAAGAVRVPAVLDHGEAEGFHWLLLEWLPMTGRTRVADRALGAALAEQHRATAGAYGFKRDGFVGANPQPNAWHHDWCEFWLDQRLGYQCRLLDRQQGGQVWSGRLARLAQAVRPWLSVHQPPASLLHGDLWAGNAAALKDGTPVIYDPAAYYGDREADLAMTRLFGGFSDAFYTAYDSAWPLPDRWQQREPLYRLYHVLNHAALFGGGYLRQAAQIMAKIT